MCLFHVSGSRLALMLYGIKNGRITCLTAVIGSKPLPTAVRKAVLTTDIGEHLKPGRYWLVLQVRTTRERKKRMTQWHCFPTCLPRHAVCLPFSRHLDGGVVLRFVLLA